MTSALVCVTAQWRVPPGQAGAITTAVQAMMLTTRSERGCVGCSLVSEMAEQITLRYREDWETEGDLRRRIQSDRFAKLLGLVECATERPRIEFTLPSGTRGLDYAEDVRREQAPRPTSFRAGSASR